VHFVSYKHGFSSDVTSVLKSSRVLCMKCC